MNDVANAPARQVPGQPEPVTIVWSGSPWSLAGLGFINLVLTILTIGIYQFWGKTEVRRRIWSSVRINGEPLEYTGTGKELFLGFLVVFFLVLIPILLVSFGAQLVLGPALAPVIALPLYIVFFFLIGVAVYRARRYRLSRTRWRGVRSALVGSPMKYAWAHFLTILLVPFTLGWITPWRSNMLHRRITNESRFGDRPFTYTGSSGRLYFPFLMIWVGGLLAIGAYSAAVFWLFGNKFAAQAEAAQTGTPPVPLTMTENATLIGLAFLMLFAFSLFGAWYYTRSLRTFTEYTSFEGAKFKLDISVPSMLGLAVTNYFLTLLTLGILRPVAEARLAKYLVDHLSVDGTVDFASIAQSQQALSKTGEGLATAFDIDAIG